MMYITLIFIFVLVKSEMTLFAKMDSENIIYECYSDNNDGLSWNKNKYGNDKLMETSNSDEKISLFITNNRDKTSILDARWQNLPLVSNISIDNRFYGYISIQLINQSNILTIKDDYDGIYNVEITTTKRTNPKVNCTLFVNNFTGTWMHLLIQISPIRKYIQIINQQIFCLQPTENNKSNKYVIYTKNGTIKFHRSNQEFDNTHTGNIIQLEEDVLKPIENISCENIKTNEIIDVFVPIKTYQDDCNIPKMVDMDDFTIICCRKNCFKQKKDHESLIEAKNLFSEWTLTLLLLLLFLLLSAAILFTVLASYNSKTKKANNFKIFQTNQNYGLLPQPPHDALFINNEEHHYEEIPEAYQNDEEYTVDGYLQPNSEISQRNGDGNTS